MGVIGLILASLVNMIWPSGTMGFRRRPDLLGPNHPRHPENQAAIYRGLGSEMAEKLAIFGALSLYINFVNLFQFLMMFLGQRR